jgi:hypothetical protein
MAEHRPTLEETVKKLQMKMQELHIKKNDLDIQDPEGRMRGAVTQAIKTDLQQLEREVAELRRQLEERDEARRRLKLLEDDIVKMFAELNTVTLAQRIQAILNDWHDHAGHLQMLVRTLFYDIDANKDGKLEWNNNEIRGFVHELFHRQNIPWPNWQEHVFYEMYRKADANSSYSLELDEASRFAKTCFEAAYQLALTGHAEHVGDLIGSGEFVARTFQTGPVARAAMTYSSGVVIDFLDHSKHFQPVIVANSMHRPRMMRIIETGDHLKATIRTYRECDKDGNGRLTWNNGEIRNFITACFRDHGLSPPSEDQMFTLYHKFDTDKNQYLDMRECLEMVDAMFRTTFIAEAPGEVVVQASPAPVYGRSTSPTLISSNKVVAVGSAPPAAATVIYQGERSGSVKVRSSPVSTAKELTAGTMVISPRTQAGFDQIDTNHDGVISRSEWDAAQVRGQVSLADVNTRGRTPSPLPQGGTIGGLFGMQARPPAPVGYPGADAVRATGTQPLSSAPQELTASRPPQELAASFMGGADRATSPPRAPMIVSPRPLSPSGDSQVRVVTAASANVVQSQMPLLSSVGEASAARTGTPILLSSRTRPGRRA